MALLRVTLNPGLWIEIFGSKKLGGLAYPF
jgi:hypothetical protein